jgi:hypothetical protein
MLARECSCAATAVKHCGAGLRKLADVCLAKRILPCEVQCLLADEINCRQRLGDGNMQDACILLFPCMQQRQDGAAFLSC